MSWDEKEQAKKIREEYNIKYNNYMTLNLEQLNLCEDKETNASDFGCEYKNIRSIQLHYHKASSI